MALYLPDQTQITAENRCTFPDLASSDQFAFLNGVDYVLTRLGISTRLIFLGPCRSLDEALNVLVDDVQRNILTTIREEKEDILRNNNLIYVGESTAYTEALRNYIANERRVVTACYELQRASDPSLRVALYVLNRLSDSPPDDVSRLTLDEQAQRILDAIPSRVGKRTDDFFGSTELTKFLLKS